MTPFAAGGIVVLSASFTLVGLAMQHELGRWGRDKDREAALRDQKLRLVEAHGDPELKKKLIEEQLKDLGVLPRTPTEEVLFKLRERERKAEVRRGQLLNLISMAFFAAALIGVLLTLASLK